MSIGISLSTALGASGVKGALAPVFGNGVDPQANIFNQGEGPRVPTTNGVPCYSRIPIIIKIANGDFLAFADCRSKQDDDAAYAIVMKRSTDKGKTWSAIQTVYLYAAFNDDTLWINAGSVVVDLADSGDITYVFSQSTTSQHTVWITRSTDDGVNWGAPTEITATTKVVAVNNPVGHTFNGTAWTWVTPTCTAGIQLTAGPNAGRLLVPFDHRFVFSTAAASYSHTIKSDDGGATWSLHGGLAEVAANDFSNECAITETPTPGRIVMHIRNTNGGVYRYQSVSTDYGATWPNMSAAATTALTGSDCSGDIKRCKDLLVASYSSDPAHLQRFSLSLAISRDEGVTWVAADRRMVYGRPAGYSSLLIDGDDVYVFFERGQGNTLGSVPTEFAMSLQMIHVDRKWLLNPTLRYSMWEFNEEAVGVAGLDVGGEIPDYGNLDERAVCGTAAVRPLYTANGIALTTGVDFINLSQAKDPAFDAYVGESICVEVDATIVNGSSGALISKYVGSTGYQLEVDGAGKLIFRCGDGTTGTVLSPNLTTVNDGVRRTYGFYRNAVTGKAAILLNGVVEGGEGNSAQAIGQLNSGLLLGKNVGDTLRIAAEFHRAKASRGIPSSFLQPNGTKKTLIELRKYTAPTLALPSLTIAPPVLWTHHTYNLGLDAYADMYLTERYTVPPPVDASFRSMRDASAARRKFINSESRRLRYVSDSKMGPAFDHDINAQVASILYDTNLVGATNGIDFIQNNCAFTVAFAVKFIGATGTLQTICDSCAQSGATNPGFSLYRENTNGRLQVLISTGTGTNRINEAHASQQVLTYGNTYFVAVVGHGIGNAYNIYIANITANYNASSPTQPTVTKYTGNVLAAVGAGPYTSLKYLRIGEYTEGGRGLNGPMKNFMVFNDDASDADIDALALFNVSG